jgi:polyisoprenoid-binding protein YceI
MATWKIDPTHTLAEFVVTHMMFTKVRGRFTDVSGTIEFDPENPNAAKVSATIQVATIASGVTDRDNHLKSPDFFNVEQFPVMTFNSTRVIASSATQATLVGELTIRDVTREVTLEVEFGGVGKTPFGTEVAGFSASTKINREDFGLTWNVALEAGGVLVGKEVTINLEVQAVRVNETQTA